jgi:MarR family transcriptional regulator, temperature-dependent positive regulator of motility
MAGNPPMIDDRGGFLVRRLNQIWAAAVAQRFRAAGADLTALQFAALEVIMEHGPLDQTDLALRIGYDRATTGGVITRLEQAGYILRQPHPTDRRSRMLVATALGRKICASLRAAAAHADQDILATLPPEAQEALFALLRSVVTACEPMGLAPAFRPSGRDGAVMKEVYPRSPTPDA